MSSDLQAIASLLESGAMTALEAATILRRVSAKPSPPAAGDSSDDEEEEEKADWICVNHSMQRRADGFKATIHLPCLRENAFLAEQFTYEVFGGFHAVHPGWSLLGEHSVEPVSSKGVHRVTYTYDNCRSFVLPPLKK